MGRPSLALISSLVLQLAYFFALTAVTTFGLSCKGGSSGGGGGGESTRLDPAAEAEPPGEQPAFPFDAHVDQKLVTRGRFGFGELFILGDELFETKFNSIDGVGILELPDGDALASRFSRVPPGGGRFTGPNGQGCNGCHNSPFGTSAGTASSNVLQDPAGNGIPPFNTRNTTSLFGSGLIQRLAEEMTEELLAIRDAAAQRAQAGGPEVTLDLVAKGIFFGRIGATRNVGGVVTFDTSEVEGVSEDLVVRAFGWKGDEPSLRSFSRGASLNELGMEPHELVLKDSMARNDPDGDGVENELSVGDITAIVVYIAGQETPTTVGRMSREGLLSPPGAAFSDAAERGRGLFEQIGCVSCHVPELRLVDPVFEEPTRRGGDHYHDHEMDVGATGLDSGRPFRFSLARQGDFPRPQPHPAGGVRVALFGDLKRHNMGRELADSQPMPVKNANGEQLVVDGIPDTVEPSGFLTPELWGVGSTGPWLHDGRAGTLEEAILLHGVDSPLPLGDPDRSESQEERDLFDGLSDDDRDAVVTFLKSLILVDVENGEE